MDAKPQRSRGLSRIRDENAAPISNAVKPGLHHRNKSTPALTALIKPLASNTNALNQGQVKRTAFADVSNTFKSNFNSSNDTAQGKKPQAEKMGNTEFKPFKDASNPTAQPQPQPQPTALTKVNALLRPAQRPLYNLNLRPTASSVNLTSAQPAVAEPSLLAATRRTFGLKNENAYLKAPLKVMADAAPAQQIRHTQSLLDINRVVQPSSYSSVQPLPVVKEQSQARDEPIPVVIQQAPTHHLRTHLEGIVDREVVPTLPSTYAQPQTVNSALPIPPLSVLTDMLSNQIATVEQCPAQVYAQVPVHAPAPVAQQYKPTLPALTISHEQQHFDRVASNGTVNPGYWHEEEEEEYFDAEGFTATSHHGANTTGQVTLHLAPQVDASVLRELEEARLWVEANKIPEEEAEEVWDTSMVAEYGEDIFGYMRELENKYRANPYYMDAQTEIQWAMRGVLMDWLVQVHCRFQLLPETLFLAVNYIDRFLSVKVVSMGKLQLVGACALFIAAKYEEINCPSVTEIIFMVDGGYTPEEILKAERFMLSMLKFELGWPGPMSFLRRISKADDYDLETRTLAKYFLEVTLMDERFVGCVPSFTAAASHCLARMMLRKGPWTHAHIHYSGYTYSQLHDILLTIVECCQNPRKHHIAVFEKYSEKRYKRAAFFVETELQRGFYIPPMPVHTNMSHFTPLVSPVVAQVPNNSYLDTWGTNLSAGFGGVVQTTGQLAAVGFPTLLYPQLLRGLPSQPQLHVPLPIRTQHPRFHELPQLGYDPPAPDGPTYGYEGPEMEMDPPLCGCPLCHMAVCYGPH